MKKITLYLFAAVMMLTVLSGCRKDVYGCTDPNAYNYNSAANVNNGTCTYYGNVMFWCAQNYGTVTVNVNSQSANINGYITGVTFDVYGNVVSGGPTCGNSVSANFTLPVGTYTYTANSSQGTTWGYQTAQTVTVTANGCNTYLLR